MLAPLLGLQFGLPGDALAVVAGSRFIGTPARSGSGALGAARPRGGRGGTA
jgi:heme exporter protein B